MEVNCQYMELQKYKAIYKITCINYSIKLVLKLLSKL